MNTTVIDRAQTRLSQSGTSQHVLVPKPLLAQIGWKVGEELELQLLSDGSARVVTRAQYLREYLDAERQRWQAEQQAARA